MDNGYVRKLEDAILVLSANLDGVEQITTYGGTDNSPDVRWLHNLASEIRVARNLGEMKLKASRSGTVGKPTIIAPADIMAKMLGISVETLMAAVEEEGDDD